MIGEVHPLKVDAQPARGGGEQATADAEAAAARVADIDRHLQADSDSWFWRDVAQRRVQALEEDQPIYGLLPHEAAELAKLKQLLEEAGQG